MSKFNGTCRVLATGIFAGVWLAVAVASAAAQRRARRQARRVQRRPGSTRSRPPTVQPTSRSSLPPVAAPASESHDLVVLFDTSASQTGVYREEALDALGGFLNASGKNDRVQLVAIDLNAIPLTEGFVAPRGAAIDAAVAKLRPECRSAPPIWALHWQRPSTVSQRQSRRPRGSSILATGPARRIRWSMSSKAWSIGS